MQQKTIHKELILLGVWRSLPKIKTNGVTLILKMVVTNIEFHNTRFDFNC